MKFRIAFDESTHDKSVEDLDTSDVRTVSLGYVDSKTLIESFIYAGQRLVSERSDMAYDLSGNEPDDFSAGLGHDSELDDIDALNIARNMMEVRNARKVSKNVSDVPAVGVNSSMRDSPDSSNAGANTDSTGGLNE